jgi:hypothetical protein
LDWDRHTEILSPHFSASKVNCVLDIFKPFVKLINVSEAQVDSLVLTFGYTINGLQNKREVLAVFAFAVNVIVQVVLFNLVRSSQFKAELLAIHTENLFVPAVDIAFDIYLCFLVIVQTCIKGLKRTVEQLGEHLNLTLVVFDLLLTAQNRESRLIFLSQIFPFALCFGLIFTDLVIVLADDCFLILK